MSTFYPGEENDPDYNLDNNSIHVNIRTSSFFDNLHPFVQPSMVQGCEGMLLNIPNGVGCACESRWCFISRREIHKCNASIGCNPDDITKIPKECMPCEDSCSICLDILDTACVKTKCKHVFHEKCISKYFDTAKRDFFGRVKCPICRSKIWPATFMNLHEIFEKYKNCNCCSRHKINRPKTLTPLNTGYVEWCFNIKRWKNNNSIREFNCRCPCRHILRWNCCRRLQVN
jgi:hypothetical protein